MKESLQLKRNIASEKMTNKRLLTSNLIKMPYHH